MPIHSAIFRQPGPILNPLGLRVPTPVHVEVFQVLKGKDRGEWSAREATTQTEFEQVGTQLSPYQARYGVALLFTEQATPWRIDNENVIDDVIDDLNVFHFHYGPASPSLCGSRFHQGQANTTMDLAIDLVALRRAPAALMPRQRERLCRECLDLVDRTPRQGDRVRVRVSGRTATITGVTADLKGSQIRYFLNYDDPTVHDPRSWTASEISLVMFDGI
jgi:hypothetical protein